MSRFNKNGSREMPEMNTSSLPDLIQKLHGHNNRQNLRLKPTLHTFSQSLLPPQPSLTQAMHKCQLKAGP